MSEPKTKIETEEQGRRRRLALRDHFAPSATYGKVPPKKLLHDKDQSNAK